MGRQRCAPLSALLCLSHLSAHMYPDPLHNPTQAISAPQGNANAFVSEQWSLRGQRMVYMNSRGPGCFDFGYYVKVRGR